MRCGGGRRDRIHRADFHPRGQHAERERGVAVDHDLRDGRADGRDNVLEVEIGLGPLVAGIQQSDVGFDHALVLLAEGKRDLLAREFEIQAVNAAQHAERKHILAAPRITDQRQAFALHRHFADLVAGRDQLVVGFLVGSAYLRVLVLAPHALNQYGATEFEFAVAHAAQQHLFIEGDHELGLVAAVGDASGANPNADAARARDAARRRPDFSRNDLLGPDAIAHLGSDRAQRLAAALRPLAGIADDLDNMLLQRDGRLLARRRTCRAGRFLD